VARVLVNRGVEDEGSANRFLAPNLKDLHPPEGLADMERAAHRVVEAIRGREPIVVHGDYDADGITATAVLVAFLRQAGARVSAVIPHRERDGYGFRWERLPTGGPGGRRLVITADCGVSDVREIDEARSRGWDVIVTDHHEVPEDLPKALAVVNPKRRDNRYPFPDLAGVGVAFLLVWAASRLLKEAGFWVAGEAPSLRPYLDLVALGTVADQAPLLGENRALVRHGLQVMAERPRPGITALLRICGSEGRVPSVGTLSFQMAPRLNAPGRVDDAAPALDLLLTEDSQEAEMLAQLVDGMNRRRQQVEEGIFREANALAEEEMARGRRAIVLAGEGWHQGVVGIVASRLVERYGVPAILVSLQDGVGKGSGRAPEGFHLMNALAACRAFLDRFGGHRQAAGLRLFSDALEDFRVAFCREAERTWEAADGAVLRIDDRLTPQQVTEELVVHLERLEPHGIGNPEPVFLMEQMEIAQCRRVGQDHLKLRMLGSGVGFDAIGFNMGGLEQEGLRGRARIACVPQFNRWQGRTTIQLKLKDLKTGKGEGE
jgi:single-stranded-DNA-specific exonuclease